MYVSFRDNYTQYGRYTLYIAPKKWKNNTGIDDDNEDKKWTKMVTNRRSHLKSLQRSKNTNRISYFYSLMDDSLDGIVQYIKVALIYMRFKSRFHSTFPCNYYIHNTSTVH